MRSLFLALAIPLLAFADRIEDAAAALAARIAPHIAANQTARVTARNLSSLPAGEATRVQMAIGKALRNAHPSGSIDVVVTLSENVRGLLLIAQIKNSPQPSVEMVPLEAEPPALPTIPVTIAKRLLWLQPEPFLDLATEGNQIFVLQARSVTVYEGKASHWTTLGSAEVVPPAIRDLRGRIEKTTDGLTVEFPGVRCSGSLQSINCSASDKVFAAGPVACGASTFASDETGLEAADSVTLREKDKPVSEPVSLPGPVLSLWPAREGALAIVHDLTSKQYAAYLLLADCSR